MSRAVYVELVDGRTVTRDAEDWRDECLARHVLAKPLPQRRAWLVEYQDKHGVMAATKLKNIMTAVHAKARLNG